MLCIYDPLSSRTFTRRSSIDAVKFEMIDGLMPLQLFSIAFQSSYLLAYCLPPLYILDLIILQRFSMRLRSGEHGGHSINQSPEKLFLLR